jgi:hypothetical protein
MAFSMDKGGVMPPSKGGSAPQKTAVGSGSRPMGGSVPIMTSAPAKPHEMDRAPSGWLK